ncbi:hypothetical protein N7492_007580 [Penicillium capsulatum]|uniref:Uncharacterized protein n=1 Tax=Penicillium capsulatum TaxID=69766 RepID=A0A9W9I024_9EURO|nr:hypothetical protein N7492_007580 [Penicillium capsulatum]
MDGSNSAQEGPVVPEHESRQPPQSNGPGFPPTLPTQEPGDSSTELNSRRCCIQDNLPSTFNASFFYPDPNPNPQAEQGPETQYQSPWADRENPPPYFGHGGGYQVGVMLDAVVPAHGEIDVRRISTVKSEMTKFDNPCLTLPLKRRSTAGALNSLLRELSKLTLSGECAFISFPSLLHFSWVLTDSNEDKITAFPRDISLTTVSHPPAPGGQNTCRTLTRLPEHYSGRAIAPLAPGKKLEMDLRILPPVGRAPGHHLRTRVRVFARFLKPRPSVVKSSQDDKKRKVCNPAFEQALESALERLSDEQLGSDTDDSEYSDSASVFDEDMASMFSSFSDISVETPIQPCYSTDLDSASESDGYFASPSPSSDLSAAPTIRPSSPVNLDAEAMPDAGVDSVQFPCTDSSMLFPTQSSLPPCADPNGSDAMFEATKVSFELDLDSSLCKMSQLPDGLAHGVYSDPTSMNPAQLLEYILKDLLYSMTVMSRSTDDDDDDAPPSDQ